MTDLDENIPSIDDDAKHPPVRETRLDAPQDIVAPDVRQPGTVPPLSLLSFVLIISAGLLFLVTLCPTVFIGDAGDFITACYKAWIPHPPGYPVYTILGHLMTLIPTPFAADSVGLIRFVAMLFLLCAGIFGIIFIIRNRDRWASQIGPFLGYLLGGAIGLFLAKTIYAFLAPAQVTGFETARGFDLTEPPAVFFGIAAMLFCGIVLAIGYIGTRSPKIRASTYIVCLVLFAIFTPIIYLLVRNLVPPTVDPVNSPAAVKVNLLSAIAAFLTVIFAYLALREIIPIEPLCGIGAFLVAIGRSFWSQAEIAEVYALNTAFIFGIFYLGFSYIRTRREWRFYLMAFLMGLALAHHYSILLFYPGLLYYIALKTGGIHGLKASFRPVKRVLLGLILVFIGLAPYAYLIMVHFETPLEYVVFNKEEEQRLREDGNDKVRFEESGQLNYFLKISSRGVYTEARKHEKSAVNIGARTTTPMVFNRYVQLVIEEFTIPIAIFGALGLLLSLRFRPGWLWIILFLCVLFSFIKPITYFAGPNPDAINTVSGGGFGAFWFGGGERLTWFILSVILTIAGLLKSPRIVFAASYLFYFGVVHFYPSEDILFAPLVNLQVVMPPLVVPLMALWACFAVFLMADVYDWIKRYAKGMAELDHTDPTIKTATLRGLAVAIFLALTIFAGYVNWPYGDKSRSLLAYNYGRNVLDACEPFSVVMTTGDEIFIFWYMQEVEGYRAGDVRVTNWIHNIHNLTELGDEQDTMARVINEFIGYVTPTGWKLVTTYLVPSFLNYPAIVDSHFVMDGLTYRIEPSPPLGFSGKADLGNLTPDDRLNIIDEIRDERLDPQRTPDNGGYYWGGLNPPVDSPGFSEYEKRRVVLDPQEKEMLARYQDILLHSGIYRLQEGRRLERSGFTELAAAQYKRASFHFRTLVSLDPADVIGWRELGETYMHTGNVESAEVCYRTILGKESADDALKADAHGALAMMYYELGKIDEATREVTESLILDPTNARALYIKDLIEKGPMEPDERTSLVPNTQEESDQGE